MGVCVCVCGGGHRSDAVNESLSNESWHDGRWMIDGLTQSKECWKFSGELFKCRMSSTFGRFSWLAAGGTCASRLEWNANSLVGVGHVFMFLTILMCRQTYDYERLPIATPHDSNGSLTATSATVYHSHSTLAHMLVAATHLYSTYFNRIHSAFSFHCGSHRWRWDWEDNAHTKKIAPNRLHKFSRAYFYFFIAFSAAATTTPLTFSNRSKALGEKVVDTHIRPSLCTANRFVVLSIWTEP